MSEALVKTEPDRALERPHPREIIRAATEEANVLAEVIESRKLYSNIQGRKFVKCEGWTTLAMLRGCLPRETSVVEVEPGRYVAEVELIRISDGMVLTRASAECGGEGDRVWQDRPANARRSMAITRATGKACRVAFSWVMALAGFEVTPMEEMDHVERGQAQSPKWTNDGPPIIDGSPAWRGKLVKVETKNGMNKNGEWTLYTFTGNTGERFGTFSKSIAEGLMALEGRFVEIIASPTSKGNQQIEEYRDVTDQEVPI